MGVIMSEMHKNRTINLPACLTWLIDQPVIEYYLASHIIVNMDCVIPFT